MPTPAQSKQAAQAALAIVTAVAYDLDPSAMINALPAVELPVVVSALAGMFDGLLRGVDESLDDAGRRFLVEMGRSVAAMPA